MTTTPVATRRTLIIGVSLAAATLASPALLLRPRAAAAATRAEIDAEVMGAAGKLHAMENTAPLFRHAHSVLIFPRIISGGFIVGGQYGEGALLRGETISGHYTIAGASFGLLAGAQSAGLAMFFMTAAAEAQLRHADGWEIGTGPSVVFLDRGVQANVSSTTLTAPVYAISFSQQGLMAALALNGTKITATNPA